MKKYFLFIIISVMTCSCSRQEQAENHPDLSQTNKIKFEFKSDFDSSDKVTIISKEIDDIKNISRVRNIINYDPFTYIYCTSSGAMSFYKDSTLIVTMVFNTLPDQKHIAFNYDGKLVAMSLSEENAKILESFKN